MNKYLTDKANVVEMILLDHNQEEHDVPSEKAWETLESKFGVIKGKNVRPDWKDPTPTGKRMISFACTKIGDRKYDGSIHFGGIQVAVFQLGRLDD
jgi:hypothetical protein